MQGLNPKSVLSLVSLFLCMSIVLSNTASAQITPPVPEQNRKYFVHYVDKRSFKEKALNLIGLTSAEVGRSFALIAGVSQYPNMQLGWRRLKPAEEDIKKLVVYLKSFEFFDEIVVLENQDMNFDNLRFFLQSYFPERLRRFPKSRFIFAYSGHGMNEGSKGYLLLPSAKDLSDKRNSLNLSNLKVLIDEVVESGHHVLVLLNACFSGAFLRRPFGRPGMFTPRNPGAHAITAGGSAEKAYHQADIGTGSIFFEKLFTGLDGRADMFPKHQDGRSGDGLITIEELATYLKQEIQIFTDQRQNPQLGDISKHGSLGSFFFLNRRRQVAQRVVPEWKPERATPFGIQVANLFNKGKEYYLSGEYNAALPFLRQAAEAGNAEAPSYLGYMYAQGLGVEKNYGEAVRWYYKGAERGELVAMWNLGKWYQDGRGVARDYGEALRWFRKGVKAGDPWAMNSLGWMYYNGWGVVKNYPEAVRWYRKGAEAGSAAAMVNLGYMYGKGFGVEQNYSEALYWYRKGTEAGDIKALSNIGVMYRDGRGVAKDYEKALHWFRKGTEAKDARAIANLGYMYEKGFGVEQNYSEALYWYRKAAEAGDIFAMGNIGVMYRDGRGVAKDYEKALHWFRKGTEAKDAWAIANLGYMYEKGFGVQKNYAEAVRWYRKAASHGDEWAINRLKKLGELP